MLLEPPSWNRPPTHIPTPAGRLCPTSSFYLNPSSASVLAETKPWSASSPPAQGLNPRTLLPRPLLTILPTRWEREGIAHGNWHREVVWS